MTPPPHITGLLTVDSLLTGNIAAFINAAEHLVLPPAVTVLGLEFGLLAAGVFVVESVFQWPGLGNYAFQAIQANDYNALLGATFVIAVMYVVINLIVDIAYLYLDPRIRYA